MRFINYTKTDAYYEFIGENGEKLIIPAVDVVLIDDESGMVTIKLVSSRRTVGSLIGNYNGS